MLHDSYFTLAFFVRKNRPLRNGELPIFARITVSGQQSELYIGRSVAWKRRAGLTPSGTRD